MTAAMGSTVCADLPSLEYCMRKRGMGVRGEVVFGVVVRSVNSFGSKVLQH